MSTEKAHIRYDKGFKTFLKKFTAIEVSEKRLWSKINQYIGLEEENTTLKNTFTPKKDRITANIAALLLLFVLKREIEKEKNNREIFISLNNFLSQFCTDDFTETDRKLILETLNYLPEYPFQFFKKDNVEILIYKTNDFYNKEDNPLCYFKGDSFKLNEIIASINTIKQGVSYKKNQEQAPHSASNISLYIKNYPERERHILPKFIGRKFVFDAIDKFISENNKGYFFLKAAPGIGKTSFAIKLANERGYPFHLIKPFRNNTGNSVKDFIKNICAQLICDNNLPIEKFPENFDEDGEFLQLILRQASEKLSEDEKIIIVVDGIDELNKEELIFFTKTDILYLPDLLPRNIFFILTMRKIDKGFKGVKLPTTDAYEDFTIEGNEIDNIKDARLYIKQAIGKKGIQEYLKTHQVSEKKFLKDLEKKSEGNFMYLYHILREVDKGSYNDITLSELPQGLNGYYKEHWDRMMADSDGISENVKLKTIYVLSNMENPISVEYLTKIIKLDTETVNSFQIQKIISDWMQFLSEIFDDEDGRKKYSFYHKSFLDFLASDDLVKTVGADYSEIAKEVKANYQLNIANDLLLEDDY
jgi:hypothetical protein